MEGPKSTPCLSNIVPQNPNNHHHDQSQSVAEALVGSCKSTKGIAVVRDPTSQHRLNFLPFTVDTMEPSPESLKKDMSTEAEQIFWKTIVFDGLRFMTAAALGLILLGVFQEDSKYVASWRFRYLTGGTCIGFAFFLLAMLFMYGRVMKCCAMVGATIQMGMVALGLVHIILPGMVVVEVIICVLVSGVVLAVLFFNRVWGNF